MKKIFKFFIVVFILMLMNINIRAEIIQSPKENTSSKYICENMEFNLIKGIDNNEDIENSSFYNQIFENLSGYVEEGPIYIFADIKSKSYSLKLKVEIMYESGKCLSYKAFLDDELIYFVEFVDEQVNIKLTKEINLYEKYKELFTCDFSDTFDYEQSTLFASGSDYYQVQEEYVEPNTFGGLYIMEYKINYGYESDDEIHFIVDSDNPLSLDEIINSIIIEDETDGVIKEYELLQTNYEVIDNYVTEGDYPLSFLVRDNAGNTSLFKAIISVYDITAPEITATDCSQSYYFLKTQEDIKKQFNIPAGTTLTIVEDNYTPNYNILGTYKVVGEVRDSVGNTNRADLYITVKDNLPPVISIEKSVCISTVDDYELDDFLKYVSAFDSGEQKETKCIIEVDMNDYMNNKRKVGIYRFYITSTDSTGNKGEAYLTVKVIDSDYPLFKADEYTLIIKQGQMISREEIIEILKKRGQVNEENIEISSDYFNEDNPEGSYVLDVVDSKGNKYKNTIEVFKSDENIDYTPKKNKVKNNEYLAYYIVGGAIIVIIVTLGVLFIVRYKKRH